MYTEKNALLIYSTVHWVWHSVIHKDIIVICIVNLVKLSVRCI